MNRYKALVLVTCLAVFATSPSYADKHDNRRDRDRHEQRYERDRHDQRRWENDQGEDHDDRGRRTWFHDHGYSHLSIPARYYPAPGQCRFWYPGLPEWRQPAAQWNCGAAPRGAWLIRHPRNDVRHVHVVVNEPSYSSQLVGEFEIGSGTFIRLVTNF